MKRLPGSLVILLFIFIVTSCKKTSFIDSPDAFVTISADTLHFDTVFTSTGSVTQSFKIFNQNDQKLRISQVKLGGGNSSFFKINVDGAPGTTFSNIELEPNDSLYIFVSVFINPNSANTPFIVQDSISVNYNGTEQLVQLQAFGQNANFYTNRRITRDSVWNNDLPFVILDKVLVDSNVTLTIERGCRIYCHADAPIIVNGTLKVNGGAIESLRVVFNGDRLDPSYSDLPGSWPGIQFTSSSSNNVLNYTVIRNAFQGIVAMPHQGNNPKITLNQCIIDNVTDAGILSIGSSIKAANCLITNCGSNISILAGGTYAFDQCTVASYGNVLVSHKNPVLFISNADTLNNNIFPLNAHFRNCIFYGDGGIVENEVLINKQGSPSPADFNITFSNVLYKNNNEQITATFTNAFNNELPEFDSIDVVKRYYDFHLKPISSAINAGQNIGVIIDLDGRARVDNLPDLGCYEQ